MITKKKLDVVVVQDPADEVPAEVLAKSIRAMGDAVKAMDRAGLNDRAIVLLLHDISGVGKPDVRAVLAGLRSLEKTYLKPKL